jgi:hypothetical protein
MNAQLKPLEPRGVILFDEPAEAYHARALHVVNNSGMKVIDTRSPAHFRYWVEEPDAQRETPALRFGKALHSAILEPDLFARTYCVLPGDAPDRPTRAMLEAKGKRSPNSEARIAWWGQWDADHPGSIVLTASDYDRVQGMAASARRHPIASAMIDGGRREVTLRWAESVVLDDGAAVELECKARVDLWQDAMRFFMDLKSTADASPEGFARSVTDYRYHVQHAHYGEGAKACGIDLRAFLFLAIESEPPYVCEPYTVNAAAEERGYQLRERAMRKQAECVRSGRWPGYSDGKTISELTLPGWAFSN